MTLTFALYFPLWDLVYSQDLWKRLLNSLSMCCCGKSVRYPLEVLLKPHINIITPFSFSLSSETSAASGHSDCPTVISVDSNQSWSGIHSSTGTGISTERSSVFSWGYDVSLLLRNKKNNLCVKQCCQLCSVCHADVLPLTFFHPLCYTFA